MKIFIDPGHGGSDPGAVGYGLREKDLTLDLSLREKVLFEKLGHQVKMSRYSDRTISLGTRTREANKWGADVFISNHINAGGGTGEEVWCSIYGGKGKEYASRVEKYLSQIFKSRGVKSKKGKYGDYFYVIRGTNMPAILVEFAFIDSASDTNKLKNSYIVQKCAESVVYGVLNLPLDYNSKEDETKPVDTTPVFKKYLRYKKPYIRGNDVKAVQSKLKELGFDAGAIDGIFGRNTARAVKSFQSSRRITVDGIVGKQTWKYLFS
ncbi:hypothetical protein SH2C18_15560 [Clostridium sediminicola]|uniref:N-acetylmuramoyl-L-alanine amidase n=1 Tax=Clostridium sediminicola TaxID=3114879 RepID=UPI0031F27A7A